MATKHARDPREEQKVELEQDLDKQDVQTYSNGCKRAPWQMSSHKRTKSKRKPSRDAQKKAKQFDTKSHVIWAQKKFSPLESEMNAFQ